MGCCHSQGKVGTYKEEEKFGFGSTISMTRETVLASENADTPLPTPVPNDVPPNQWTMSPRGSEEGIPNLEITPGPSSGDSLPHLDSPTTATEKEEDGLQTKQIAPSAPKVVIKVASADEVLRQNAQGSVVPVDTRPLEVPASTATLSKKELKAREQLLRESTRRAKKDEEKRRKLQLEEEKKQEKQRLEEERRLEKERIAEEKRQKRRSRPLSHADASLSTSALGSDGVTYVYFNSDEKKEIRDTAQIFGQFFTDEDLRRMYARFKENGKQILRTEFTMVYAMYGRNVEPALAFRVFDLFDAKKSGAIGFLDFIHFMAVVLKGSPRQKLEYSFRLFDRDGDGMITREDITELLSHLPIQKMLARRQQNIARLIRRKNSDILEPVTEEEETEEGEARVNHMEHLALQSDIQAQERLRAQREQEKLVRDMKRGAGDNVRPSVSSLNHPPSPGKDPRNVALARRIAEEVFDDAQCGKYINLLDFMVRVAPQEAMQAFFPF